MGQNKSLVYQFGVKNKYFWGMSQEGCLSQINSYATLFSVGAESRVSTYNIGKCDLYDIELQDDSMNYCDVGSVLIDRMR